MSNRKQTPEQASLFDAPKPEPGSLADLEAQMVDAVRSVRLVSAYVETLPPGKKQQQLAAFLQAEQLRGCALVERYSAMGGKLDGLAERVMARAGQHEQA